MKRLSCARSFALLLSLAAISVLTGCSGNFSMPETAGSVAAPLDNGTGDIVGGAYGGRQPIQGARIYLYGAPNSGYTVPTSSTTGSSVPSYAGISLLGNNGGCNASQNLHLDQFGVCYYLTGTGTETFTDSNNATITNTSVQPGSFNLTGLYKCNVSSASAAAGTLPGQQVWLYSVSGDPGAGNGAAMNLNTAAGLAAALGTCPASNNFSSLSFIYMNEVSTVAFAYAVAGFAADATHVSAPTSNYTTGLANAFANAAQLYDISGGPDPGNHSGARYKTPNGYGTPPFILINSVADILAACINSQYSQPAETNGISTECNNLLYPGNGAQIATDTASAAVYIARHPSNANIFQFLSTVEPWHPAFNDGTPYRNPNNGVSTSIPSYPNELTAAILFAGSGYSAPAGIAADSAGNVFVSMEAPATGSAPAGANTIAKISPLGAITNSSPVNIPTSIVLDQFNNVFSVGTGAANGANGNLIEITNTTANEGSTGGSATVSGTPNSYVNTGLSQTGTPSPSISSLPLSIAANGKVGAGYVYIADYNDDDLVQVNASTGQVTITYVNGNYTAGKCLTGVDAVAVDQSGALWTGNQTGTVCRTNLTGPSRLFAPVTVNAAVGGLALDKANNAWVSTPSFDDLFYVTSAGSVVGPLNGGGLDFPTLITVDGNGSPWILNGFGTPYNTTGTNAKPPSISEFSSISGGNPSSLSPSSNGSYKGGYQFKQISQPAGIAIDISGNVWVSNNATAAADPYANSVVELIGAATPTLSPILSTPGTPEVEHGTEQQ